jgi:hypothetical protein
MAKKILLVITILFAFSAGSYGQVKDLNFKLTHQIIESESHMIGDEEGHSIGVAKGTGLGYFEDDGVAVLTAYFIFDYTNGSGEFTGYYVIELADGSEITMKAVGTALEYSDEKKTIFNTDVTYISGKGKYLGITGSGRMTGQRKNRVESGAPVFLEVTSTYENR